MTNLDRMYNPQQQSTLDQAQSQAAAIRNVAQSANNSPNPYCYFQQMAAGNPAVQQAFQLLQQNGGNAKQAVMALANQTGFNVASLMQQLGMK